MSANRWSYRPDIDGLRAVSILLVVGFHAGWSALEGGYVGVDVFFVLSGYLITGLLASEARRSDRISLREFYARRARRLLPMAWLVITTTLVAGFFLVAPLRRAGLIADARAGALYLANWRFANQATAYSDVEVSDGLFIHLWSLSIEEQYYLVWPMLVGGLVALARWRGRSFVPLVLAGAAAIVVASFVTSIVTSRQGPRAYYLTHARVWEIGLGAVLAMVVPRLPRLARWLAELLAAGGVVMIVVAALTFDASTVFPGYAALLPVLGSAAVIVAGAQRRTSVSVALSVRPMRELGQLSYAWYLWHWPAIGLAMLWSTRNGSTWGATQMVIGAVIISLGLALLSNRLFETPVRHSPRLVASRLRTLGLGALLTLSPVLLGFGLARLDHAAEITITLPDSESARPRTFMTPAAASTDFSALPPGECHVTIAGRDVVSGCEYGDPDGTTIVALVGDSHAQHWLPALDQAGRERGWKVLSWNKSSCTVIDVPLRNNRLERYYEECASWREGVLDQIRSYDGIDLAIIADSYNYTGMVLDSDGNLFEDQEALLAAWGEAAARTFEAYRAETAHPLILMRDVPWAPADVPDCLSEQPTDPGQCGFELDRYAWLDADFLARELEVGGSDVVELDMTRAICDSDPCSVVTRDGTIKYRDRHHLTRTFSVELADALGAELEAMLSADAAR